MNLYDSTSSKKKKKFQEKFEPLKIYINNEYLLKFDRQFSNIFTRDGLFLFLIR